jgi:hypothetical protein
MTTIDLDALVNTARLPKVKLFGREMAVYPMTGAAAHRVASVQEADANGAKMLGALLDVIKITVPELTEDERDLLSVDQIAALIQLSRGQIAEVETMLADRAEKN